MKSSLTLEGPRHGPQRGDRPKQLVVLLHGWGANGDDLIGLAPYLAPALPEALFVSPNAPFPCEANPMGLQWFGLMDIGEAARLAGLRLAAGLVDAFLDEELQRHGLVDADLAIVGFSQGTMLGLHVAPRRPQAPAALVGFSGMLMAPDLLAAEIKVRPPVLLVHGERDTVVPPQASVMAAEALKAAGLPVELKLRPGLVHSIDEPGLRFAQAHLRRGFGLE